MRSSPPEKARVILLKLRTKINKDPLLAAEDIEFQDFSFISETFYYLWDLPSYAAYYVTADRGPAYRIAAGKAETTTRLSG